ncbi:MAG: CAP domain-containing protein, partial [Acidimicrobiales bacterium]
MLLLASLMVVVPVRALGEDPSAAAGPDDEAAFVAAINAVRADVGLPALTVSSELTALARAHAQLMADATEIFHADPISAGL